MCFVVFVWLCFPVCSWIRRLVHVVRFQFHKLSYILCVCFQITPHLHARIITYQFFKDQSFHQLHLFLVCISCASTLSHEAKIFRGFGRLITSNPIKMNTWPLASLVSCMASLGSWPFRWSLASRRSLLAGENLLLMVTVFVVPVYFFVIWYMICK